MTQSTEQECAEVIYTDQGINVVKDGVLIVFIPWEQAARRAQVVPQFSPIAQTKLSYLLEAGEAITGYAIENKDGRRGAIDCHGFVYWWNDAAAPQTPACNQSMQPLPELATKAAPVQMPEPKFTAHKRGRLIEVDPLIGAFDLKDGDYALYTEQDLHQVRQILAAHGIKTEDA